MLSILLFTLIDTILRPLVKSAYLKNNFLISQPKRYVVGTQKNRLNETVLLSTQNICNKIWVRKYLLFYAENFCLSKPMYIEILHPKHLQKNMGKKISIILR